MQTPAPPQIPRRGHEMVRAGQTQADVFSPTNRGEEPLPCFHEDFPET